MRGMVLSASAAINFTLRSKLLTTLDQSSIPKPYNYMVEFENNFCPAVRGHRRNIAIRFGVEKLVWCVCLPDGEKIVKIRLLVLTQYMKMTDSKTDVARQKGLFSGALRPFIEIIDSNLRHFPTLPKYCDKKLQTPLISPHRSCRLTARSDVGYVDFTCLHYRSVTDRRPDERRRSYSLR